MTLTTYHGGPKNGETKELDDYFIATIKDTGIRKNKIIRWFYVRSEDKEDMHLIWSGNLLQWRAQGCEQALRNKHHL